MNNQFSHLPAESTGLTDSVRYVGGTATLLIHYRYLIYNMVMRDLKSRSRNSVIVFM